MNVSESHLYLRSLAQEKNSPWYIPSCIAAPFSSQLALVRTTTSEIYVSVFNGNFDLSAPDIDLSWRTGSTPDGGCRLRRRILPEGREEIRMRSPRREPGSLLLKYGKLTNGFSMLTEGFLCLLFVVLFNHPPHKNMFCCVQRCLMFSGIIISKTMKLLPC